MASTDHHERRIISVGNGHGDYPELGVIEMHSYMGLHRTSGEDSLANNVVAIPVNEARILEVDERFARKRLLAALHDVLRIRNGNTSNHTEEV